MPKMRKTDKCRLIEKRGDGELGEYKPWLKVHEFGSSGRVHRVKGWKTGRIHQLMSDLEMYYFVLAQWDDSVIDIKEQYPLLPIEWTLLIAETEGISHPPREKRLKKDKTVMTTDFLITRQNGFTKTNHAVCIKPYSKLSKERTREKLFIEKEYWNRRGISWEIVTENQIDEAKAKNLKSLYMDYFWDSFNPYSSEMINILIESFKELLIESDFNVSTAIRIMEKEMRWEKGKGINFFRYLIVKKQINCDLSQKLNPKSIRVWL